jgi:hypothetical protein
LEAGAVGNVVGPLLNTLLVKHEFCWIRRVHQWGTVCDTTRAT